METVFDFTLPRGYSDENGNLHKNGKMRLTTVWDEISAKRNPKVLEIPSYFMIVLLSKVITHLEGVEMITPDILEKLYTADLGFLLDMYKEINAVEIPQISVVCPCCKNKFKVESNFTQEIYW